MSLLTAPVSQMSSPSHDYQSVRRGRNYWPLSFVLAGIFHIAIIFGGGYAFMSLPEYGIQGSTASIDVYMVAARPDLAPSIALKPILKEKVLDIPIGKSEMVIPKQREEKPENKRKENESAKILKSGQSRRESNVKGDGSSVVAGQSVTTLFSRGASEINGKSGKYRNPPPQYPAEAQRKGWQGVVMVKAFIDKEGKPSKVLLEKSSGYQVLDKAALNSVKDWRFESGHIGNRAVESWVQIPIRFVLENE